MTEVVLTIDGISHKLTDEHSNCFYCSLKRFCEDNSKQTCYDLSGGHGYIFKQTTESPIDKIDKISEGIDKILKILEK